MLISHVDTRTVLHKDYLGVHGLIGQIEGRKRFGLAPPDVALSDGDFLQDDTRLTYVEIGPGDLLYFPCEYWHQAETLETSVTFVGNVVNRHNIDHFMSRVCAEMPEFVQRVFSAHVARGQIGTDVAWQCKGFRVLAS
jgi:ribosomal protein L16 Arg81 hydroxylase